MRIPTTTLLALLFLTTCSPDSTDTEKGEDSQAETGETGDTQSNTHTETGCVRGQLRDYDNAALPNAQLRAFTHPPCNQRSETTTGADGTFCIDNIPVDRLFEMQAEFQDRCSWWHAQELGPLNRGGCDEQVLTCLDLGVWFECTPVGGTANCE